MTGLRLLGKQFTLFFSIQLVLFVYSCLFVVFNDSSSFKAGFLSLTFTWARCSSNAHSIINVTMCDLGYKINFNFNFNLTVPKFNTDVDYISQAGASHGHWQSKTNKMFYETCNENITNLNYHFKKHKTCLGHLQMQVRLGYP